VASVRSCEKLPPCLIKPVPAGSEMDPPLAKAKPVSDGGNIFKIVCDIIFKKGNKKNSVVKSSEERGLRRCEKNNSADTKVSEEVVGRRCSRHRSREPSLAARDEDDGEAGCPPVLHGGPQSSRSPPAARGRDPTLQQVDVCRKL